MDEFTQSTDKSLIGDDDAICPFTLNSLNSINPLNIAVVYKSSYNKILTTPTVATVPNANKPPQKKQLETKANTPKCGHKCSLLPLTHYLHDEECLPSLNDHSFTAMKRLSSSFLCPVCLHEPILSIFDGISNSSMMKKHQQQQQLPIQSSVPKGMVNDSQVNTSLTDKYEFLYFKYGKIIYNLAFAKKVEGEESITKWFWAVVKYGRKKDHCKTNITNGPRIYRR